MVSSVGQVTGSLFRWDGKTEAFHQEDNYAAPEVVKMEFQAAQNQLAWVADRGQGTSNKLASVEWELKRLWVQVRLEQKYLRHLIEEHLVPLQHSLAGSFTGCQCPIVGNFGQSPVPASFVDLHSEVAYGHDRPPPLESVSSTDSFVSFWEELNAIPETEVPTIEQEGGSSYEVEASDAETSEEAWEDVSSGGSGGSGDGGEGTS
jgi:hypothetical protein